MAAPVGCSALFGRCDAMLHSESMARCRIAYNAEERGVTQFQRKLAIRLNLIPRPLIEFLLQTLNQLSVGCCDFVE